MLSLKPRDLKLAGWLLAVLSMGLGVVVSIPIAQSALEAIDRATLRAWLQLLVLLLALPGISLAMLTFHFGGRLLRRAGIDVVRSGESASN